jgi:hypothetical protein
MDFWINRAKLGFGYILFNVRSFFGAFLCCINCRLVNEKNLGQEVWWGSYFYFMLYRCKRVCVERSWRSSINKFVLWITGHIYNLESYLVVYTIQSRRPIVTLIPRALDFLQACFLALLRPLFRKLFKHWLAPQQILMSY